MRSILVALSLIPTIGMAQSWEADYLPDYKPDHEPRINEEPTRIRPPLIPYLPKGDRIVTIERKVPDYLRRLQGDKDATMTVIETYRDNQRMLWEEVLSW